MATKKFQIFIAMLSEMSSQRDKPPFLFARYPIHKIIHRPKRKQKKVRYELQRECFKKALKD